MTWTTGYYYMPQYGYVSVNQHGERFKKIQQKKLNVARLSCKLNNATDMAELILLSHSLDVSVHYDFEDQMAYIEVVSADVLRRA